MQCPEISIQQRRDALQTLGGILPKITGHRETLALMLSTKEQFLSVVWRTQHYPPQHAELQRVQFTTMLQWWFCFHQFCAGLGVTSKRPRSQPAWAVNATHKAQAELPAWAELPSSRLQHCIQSASGKRLLNIFLKA